MTSGPPPSAAGPSRPLAGQPPAEMRMSAPVQGYYATNPAQSAQPAQPSVTSQHYYPTVAPPLLSSGSSSNAPPQTAASRQTYYNYPGTTWQNGWSVTGYPYPSGNPPAHQQPHYSQIPYAQYQQGQPYQPKPQPQRANPVSHAAKPKPQPKPTTPSPSPPPLEFHRHWDGVIRSFLSQLGLSQALRGFESDMLVMNRDWERSKVPGALGDLMKNLLLLGKATAVDEQDAKEKERPLDERKLDYVYLSNGAEPRSQTSINKSISAFLAQNRARNDASNRTEFLYTLSQKRRRLDDDVDPTPSDLTDIPSCARTDAKPLNRDLQMKYDIAKNEDGPLRRTVKESGHEAVTPTDGTSSGNVHRRHQPEQDDVSLSKPEPVTDMDTADQHPGLDERLVNIETHFSIRYVPSPPRTLLTRLKFLEDHITKLEKDYPPWAALHFNQPSRGWPPPPRSTPIIVPSHLRLSSKHISTSTTTPFPTTEAATGGGKPKATTSSLHRAVLERLEVQQAMSDLAGSHNDIERVPR